MAKSGSVSHLLVQATDLDRLEEFYTQVVGFSVAKRETFDEDRPLVVFEERMGLTELPGERADAGQVLEHVAFQVSEFDALVDRLHEHDVPIDDGAVLVDLPDARGRDGDHTEHWPELFEEFTFTYHDLDYARPPHLMKDPDDVE